MAATSHNVIHVTKEFSFYYFVVAVVPLSYTPRPSIEFLMLSLYSCLWWVDVLLASGFLGDYMLFLKNS